MQTRRSVGPINAIVVEEKRLSRSYSKQNDLASLQEADEEVEEENPRCSGL